MTRLGIAHPRLSEKLLCPGCKTLLNSQSALHHIPGCVQCYGFNATTKHNSLVKYLFDLANKAGIPCEKEPRAFSTWRCGVCSRKIEPENKFCSARWRPSMFFTIFDKVLFSATSMRNMRVLPFIGFNPLSV